TAGETSPAYRDPAPSCRVVAQPETHMGGGGIRRTAHASRNAVAVAIAAMAEEGATLQQALAILAGHGVTRFSGGAERLYAEKLRAPFPGVSSHVEKPVAIGLECIDGSGGGISVSCKILFRKPALPDVASRAIVRRVLVAPWIGDIAPAAGGEFPFAFGKQASSRPAG